ncbi:MAG TPA: RecX family transcriptional regulator [Candidatus Saccharimonadales bacterium]|nr:RecX family transcriptional regulator [Candidatus Saccharimonadales bacterium]
MYKITDIKQQLKRPDRYSIYIDGVFAFGLSEAGLLQGGLAVGQAFDEQKFKALQESAQADKVYGNALRYVVMRPRSEWELRTYLQRKKVDEPLVRPIVERLTDLNLLGDRAFAETWVANRRLLKPTSRRKLVLELKQKHVADTIINEVLAEDDTPEQDVLQQIIVKKRAKYADNVKFMQYLARQGFGYDDIKRALLAGAENTAE